MLKRLFCSTALVTLVGAGLLLWPQTSEAQRGGGGHGGGHGGGGHGGGYGGYHGGYGGYGGYGHGYGGYGHGWGGYGLGLGYGYGSSYYPSYGYSGYTPYYSYSPSYYSYSPGYSDYGTYSYAPQTQTYQSFYPPADNTSQDNRVHFMVRVPDSNAEVFFEGTRTQQTGTEREFVSPELTPGRTFTYHIRTRWMDNGQQRDETRDVNVRAGQALTVDFSRPAPAATGAENLKAPREDLRIETEKRQPQNPAPRPGTEVDSSGRVVRPPAATTPEGKNRRPDNPAPDR
jgi:uncharacterized protein (TIGR03000 family)